MSLAPIIQTLLGFFGQGIGQKIGNAVSTGASVAALAPLGALLLKEKDTVIATLTLGDVALFGGVLFAIIQVAHLTRPGRREDRSE